MRTWMRKMMLSCLAPVTLAAAARAHDPLPVAYGPLPSGAPITLTNGATPYGAMPHGAMPHGMPYGPPAYGAPPAMPYGALPPGAAIGHAPVAGGAPMVGGGAPAPGTIVEDPAAPARFSGFSLTPENARFRIYGWADGGYVYNASQPDSHFNGPYNSVYRNEGMFNQGYLIAEYALPREGWGVGFRADAMYGMDYLLAQSRGWELTQDGTQKWNENQFYGFATPQIYGVIGTANTNVKIGHFYTIVGYESMMAAENFFYSKSYNFQFAQPYTHWGVLATHNFSDNLQIQGGATLGWNSLDTDNDHASGIGMVKYTGCNKNWWASLSVTSGQEFNNPAGLPLIVPSFANRTYFSYILDVMATQRLEFAVHPWVGFQDNGIPGGGTAYWFGVDQYAYFRINDCLKFGTRLEWFRDPDGTRVGLTLPNNPNQAPLPGSYYSATLGFNYSPCSNLIIRPEARADWVTNHGTRRPYDDGNSLNQFMFGVDAILKF